MPFSDGKLQNFMEWGLAPSPDSNPLAPICENDAILMSAPCSENPGYAYDTIYIIPSYTGCIQNSSPCNLDVSAVCANFCMKFLQPVVTDVPRLLLGSWIISHCSTEMKL